MIKRVCISGVYSDVNRGSAALTTAAIEAISSAFPSAQISLIALGTMDVDGDDFASTRERYPEVEILPPAISVSPIMQGLRAVLKSLAILVARKPARFDSAATRRVRESDLVVGRGGVIVFDRPTMGGLVSLWLGLFPLLLASRMGKRAVLWGAHVGPLEDWRSRLVAGVVLRRCDLLFVRGPRSRTAAERAGVDRQRIIQMPDSVLGLPVPNSAQVSEVAERFGVDEGRFGVVALSGEAPQPYNQDAFMRQVHLALRPLLDGGFIDEVLVAVQAPGPDSSVSHRFVEVADDRRYRLTDPSLDFRQLTALYASSTFMLGLRMHSAIFGLAVGVASYAFDREYGKAWDVFEELGLADLVIPFPHLSPKDLASLLMLSIEDREAITERVMGSVGTARQGIGAALSTLRSLW